MSWTTPWTATVGQILTAALMNQTRDDLNVLSPALLIPAHQSGQYYGSQFQAGTTTASVTLGQLYGVPFVVPASATYDRIACYTSSAAAGNVRMGIYNDNAGVPGSLVLDAGAMAVGGTSNILTISQLLTGPAKYWLVSLFSAGPTMYVYNASAFIGSGAALSVLSATCGAQRAFAYAALPDPFTPSGAVTFAPVVSLRAL
jgi:hypothetical protein